jgi:alkylation response protein AidB-like acyl-CoA dehydrogenase
VHKEPTVRIGLMIGADKGRYRQKVAQLVADAEAAEAAGFTSIWVPQVPGDFDPFTMITLMGRATRVGDGLAQRGRPAAPPRSVVEPDTAAARSRSGEKVTTTHASDDVQQRFSPGLISGRERWCQRFSEPDTGSDLAALRTAATRDGDAYVPHGHKIWTSYSDVANWCFLLARTDLDGPKHNGRSAFAVPMHQRGIEQYRLRMINGITREFGQVVFDGARVPAVNMIGKPR